MIRTRTRGRSAGLSRKSISGYAPSPVCQIDATLAVSYPGSGQPFYNIITSPADGSAQSAYDYVLGLDNSVATDDPTFTGSAGSPSAYFAFDGGDYFGLSGSNTSFLANAHRTDVSNPFWAALSFKSGAIVNSQYLFGTTQSASNTGIRVAVNSVGGVSVAISDGTTNVSNTMLASGTVVEAVDYLLVFSYNNTAQTWSVAINSRTFTTGSVVLTPITAAASIKFNVGTAGTSTIRVLSGGLIRGYSMGQGTLNNTQLSTIVDYYNRLHGRTYA